MFVIAATFNGCTTKGNDRSKSKPAETDKASQVDSLVIELIGKDATTVLELLQRDHRVTGQSSAMGYFITAIDSISSSNETFWIYTVNDSTPSLACDRYITSNGDIIKWHLKKPNH
jgi:hypothetical protein